jgi:ribose transport system substrate-binding protein
MRPTSELLLALSENSVLGTGPHGETPTPPIGFGLTDDELRKVRAMNATAAIVMHYGDSDWSRAQVAGLRAEFAEMGIEVIAVTDAGFDAEKQVADIEQAAAKDPDVIVSIPTDPISTAAAYRQAAAHGVKLVFMDNVPKGMRHGEDYVSVASADNFGNGVASAHLMAEGLDGQGAIGVVYHDADFFVTRQRYDAFEQTIRQSYPDIEIVDERGIRGPDFVADAERVATDLLERHPDLSGIWAVWDEPAEGVMAAARRAGRSRLVITTVDLGLNVALELARGGLVFGVGAQRPFDQGVYEAELAAYGLLDKVAPAYVALPALPVSRLSVLDAWEAVYHGSPPQPLVEAATRARLEQRRSRASEQRKAEG